MYNLICARTIGSSHLRSNTPCQDYGLTKETENYRIFAVSDGHGDPNCFRSDRGSRIICETVLEILPHFINTVIENNNTDLLFELDKNLLKQLSASIIGNWLCRIEDDVANEPITSEIIDSIKERTGKSIKYAEDYIHNIRTERAYGCTLIAGIQTDDFLFLLHHGDGKCIVINDNGKISQPVPWDSRCVGSMTTSCCDNDAISSIRYSLINLNKNKVLACFLSSDGVEDSFATIDAMYSFFLDNVTYAVKNGIDELSKDWTETLPQLSAMGSADDITICGIIDLMACSPFISSFENFSKKTNLIVSLEKTEDKIRSILNGGLFSHLKRDCLLAENSYNNAKSEYDKLCDIRSQIEHDLSLLSTQLKQSENPIHAESNIITLITKLYKLHKEGFRSDSVKRCVEELSSILQRIESSEKEKDAAELKLNEAKKAFEAINNEYTGYLTLKNNLEQQIAALQN